MTNEEDITEGKKEPKIDDKKVIIPAVFKVGKKTYKFNNGESERKNKAEILCERIIAGLLKKRVERDLHAPTADYQATSMSLLIEVYDLTAVVGSFREAIMAEKKRAATCKGEYEISTMVVQSWEKELQNYRTILSKAKTLDKFRQGAKLEKYFYYSDLPFSAIYEHKDLKGLVERVCNHPQYYAARRDSFFSEV
ncbi:hypothetical protein BC833DRAFT_640757 [Globomyces pollinis-pini]|nr:hypothetical protein BC833DRAFT_640757 [Globomyces pollinis-pini]